MVKKKREGFGRPTVITEEVLRKLETAFAMGCSDREACLYADIGSSTLYDYQNANPDFLERKNALKEKPVLMARAVILDKLQDKDAETAKWYLERKKKDEFSTRQEITGEDGQNLMPTIILAGVDGGEQETDIQDTISEEA